MNILSSLVRYVEIALPIGYEVINKDLHLRCKRQASITKNQHFRALVKQAVLNQVLFDYVLADSWFGAKDNMEFIHYELNNFSFLA